MKLTLSKSKTGFRWNLKSSSDIIASGQGYSRRMDMMKTLKSMWFINSVINLVQIRGDWYPIIDLTRGKKEKK